MNWPKEWKEKAFIECVTPIPTDRTKQIQANVYRKNGRFPVVDQGQNIIAGWTDDESLILRKPLPLIIFGDHTRVLKYIDFPFAIGADGTKIFKVNESDFDSRFFYYTLLNLNIPSKGYNRHFKLLKEQKIIYPDLPEQRKIATVLFRIQKAIEFQEAIIERTRELKKAAMQFVFTHGLHGEKTKETEIGRIPESWEVMPLSQGYNLTKKGKELHLTSYDNIAFIPMELISKDGPYLKEYILKKPAEISSGTYIENGDILIAKITPCFENGKQAIIRDLPNGFGMATTEVIPIHEKKDISDRYFLFYYLLKPDVRSLIAGKMEGATGRQRIPAHIIENLTIPFPSSLEEQQKIGQVFLRLDQKIALHTAKKSALQDLFKTMLNKLMSGKIRVKDLIVNASEE